MLDLLFSILLASSTSFQQYNCTVQSASPPCSRYLVNFASCYAEAGCGPSCRFGAGGPYNIGHWVIAQNVCSEISTATAVISAEGYGLRGNYGVIGIYSAITYREGTYTEDCDLSPLSINITRPCVDCRQDPQTNECSNEGLYSAYCSRTGGCAVSCPVREVHLVAYAFSNCYPSTGYSYRRCEANIWSSYHGLNGEAFCEFDGFRQVEASGYDFCNGFGHAEYDSQPCW